ncbi:MAG: helix-turn-helix domain-containing protein [Candidatus Omnitrophica bacterium]|nr:helix-turn-helix domain-containing protein [Candidatus Omnitrophota bacterium]
MKKKVNASLKKLVLSQHKKNPALGVRKLADLLKKEYGISLSKSTVHSLLRSKGEKLKKGAKKAKAAYKKKELDEAGLMILRCIDSQIGFFDYLADELKIYLPKLKKELIKKFIILISFASLLVEDLDQVIRRKSFLRLTGLNRFPAKKFNYFKQLIKRYQPIIELKPLDKNLILIAGVKIIFRDGSYIFSDPRLTTLWDNLPQIDYFFASFKSCKERIVRMLNQKCLIFGYTKSFDYLSDLVFKLNKSKESQIAKIEFFDLSSKLIEQIKVDKKIDIILGYYPKGIGKGVRFSKNKSSYSRIHLEQLGSFYLMNIYAEFLQLSGNNRVTLNNVLINDKSYGLPNWGIITFLTRLSKEKVKGIFKNYIYLWPELEKNLFEGTKEIESSFLKEESKREGIDKMIPNKLVISKLDKLGRVSQLLLVIAKESIKGLEPRRKSGFLETGKDYILLVLSGASSITKKRLNKQAFFVDKKRVIFG